MTALVLFHYLRRRIPVLVFMALYFAGIILANALVQYRAVPEKQRAVATGQEILAEQTANLAPQQKQAILSDNVADLYNVRLPIYK